MLRLLKTHEKVVQISWSNCTYLNKIIKKLQVLIHYNNVTTSETILKHTLNRTACVDRTCMLLCPQPSIFHTKLNLSKKIWRLTLTKE